MMKFVPIFATVLFTVVGQLLIKQGMLQLGAAPNDTSRLPLFALKAVFQWQVFLGFVSAGLAATSWMVAMSRNTISFAYPFMGLSIVLTLLLAPLCFGEHVPTQRWVGVLIVCVGIVIAAQGR
jgi:drug/metabolite transporter (DMT)-like permease